MKVRQLFYTLLIGGTRNKKGKKKFKVYFKAKCYKKNWFLVFSFSFWFQLIQQIDQKYLISNANPKWFLALSKANGRKTQGFE